MELSDKTSLMHSRPGDDSHVRKFQDEQAHAITLTKRIEFDPRTAKVWHNIHLNSKSILYFFKSLSWPGIVAMQKSSVVHVREMTSPLFYET